MQLLIKIEIRSIGRCASACCIWSLRLHLAIDIQQMSVVAAFAGICPLNGTFNHFVEHIGRHSRNNSVNVLLQLMNCPWMIHVYLLFQISLKIKIEPCRITWPWCQLISPLMEIRRSWRSYKRRWMECIPVNWNHRSSMPKKLNFGDNYISIALTIRLADFRKSTVRWFRQPINRTKQSLWVDASAFRWWLEDFKFPKFILIVDVAIQVNMRFIVHYDMSSSKIGYMFNALRAVQSLWNILVCGNTFTNSCNIFIWTSCFSRKTTRKTALNVGYWHCRFTETPW